MRQQGRIVTWKDEKGFGFIIPDAGGEQVFVHIKAFTNRNRRPVENDVVTYELGTDTTGRTRAKNTEFVDDTVAWSAAFKRRSLPLTVGTVFLFLLAIGAIIGKVPWPVVAFYAGISVIAFCFYAVDKSAAQNGQWRTPESTLHCLGLLGGWPGAAAGQTILRHKSKKLSFRITYWITVLLNCTVLAWLLFFPEGNAVLDSILEFLPQE